MPIKPSIKLLAWPLLGLAIVNLAFGPWPGLGWLIFLALSLVFGNLAGRLFAPTWAPIERFFTGLGLLGSWIILSGAVWIYLGLYDRAAVGILTLSFGLLLLVGKNPSPPIEETTAETRINLRGFFLGLGFVFLLVTLFRLLIRAATIESIRSPWEVLPWSFFLLLFLAILILILLQRNQGSESSFWAGLALIFLLFALTFFVYPIGYGFDPYVHVAAENHLAEVGLINPKPFSALGQYALVIFLHQTTGAPVFLIDRLLLPFLLSFCFLWAARRAFRVGLNLQNSEANLATLLLLLLPFNQWIVTTPQGLGNALTFFALALIIERGFRPSLAALLASLASLAVHPLSGLPVLFLFYFTLARRLLGWFPARLRWFFYLTISAGLTAVFPFLFYVFGALGGLNLLPTVVWPETKEKLILLFERVIPSLPTRFNFWSDLVYLYERNLPFLVILTAVLMLIIWRKQKKSFWLLPLTALITLINALFLFLFIRFSYLPPIEQTGYAERLAEVGFLFLWPLVLAAAAKIIQFGQRLGLFLRLGLWSLMAGLAVINIYLSFPHYDVYTMEHGWSVSASDLAAVYFIESDGQNEPYLVLANQAVAAAALREFGFKKYFPLEVNGQKIEAFYYSIPTGGPLYQYFHQASYGAPIRQTIQAAMERLGVQRGYFVINQYWSRSNKLIERAKDEADDWQEFGSGRVLVFKFLKKAGQDMNQ